MPQVTQQPLSTPTLSEKHGQLMDDARNDHQHQSCHNARWRRIVIPAIFLFITAIVLVFFDFGSVGSGGGELLRRATDATNDQSSGLVKNKLYLIIVLVGLFLVVIAAIMLSFWCCKSSFQNPLCCPCYLCACCGGLACLECISCGLCAEGLEDLNV